MNKILIPTIVIITALTASFITHEFTKQATQVTPTQSIIPVVTLELIIPTITPTPRPVIQIKRQPTSIPAPVQDSALKIEKCKVQAQILAKQGAGDWLKEMIVNPEVIKICGGTVSDAPNSDEQLRRSDCYLGWTKSLTETANNIEKNQYYPALYAQCLAQ